MQTAPATAEVDPRFAPFEAKLAAKGYVPKGWLDVIDSCNFHDRRTNQKVDLDRDRLQAIADKRNKLVLERESVSHYCLGHTDDDAPEWEQPPLAGLASRWRVGRYADGTPNLEAFSWERPGHEGVFDEYPQRSAELFLNPDDINPIALLKSTTPRRDLSLRLAARLADYDDRPTATSTRSVVRFWRGADAARRPILFTLKGADMGEQPVKCEDDGAEKGPPKEEAKPEAPEAETPGAAWMDQLFASDQWKQAMAKIDKVNAFAEKAAPIFDQLEQEATGGDAGGRPPADAPPAGAPGGAAPPVPAGPASPPPGAGGPPEEDTPSGPPARNSAAFATAGYGSTSMPGYEHERLSRDHAVRLQRMEADFAKVVAERDAFKAGLEANTKETAALKLQRMEDETNAALDALAREGVLLRRDKDFADLVRLSRDKRAEAITFMRETRQKVQPAVPGNGKPVVGGDAEVPGNPVRFSRGEVAGDPTAVTQPLPDDYDQLTAIAGQFRQKGVDPRYGSLTPAAGETPAIPVR